MHSQVIAAVHQHVLFMTEYLNMTRSAASEAAGVQIFGCAAAIS